MRLISWKYCLQSSLVYLLELSVHPRRPSSSSNSFISYLSRYLSTRIYTKYKNTIIIIMIFFSYLFEMLCKLTHILEEHSLLTKKTFFCLTYLQCYSPFSWKLKQVRPKALCLAITLTMVFDKMASEEIKHAGAAKHCLHSAQIGRVRQIFRSF